MLQQSGEFEITRTEETLDEPTVPVHKEPLCEEKQATPEGKTSESTSTSAQLSSTNTSDIVDGESTKHATEGTREFKKGDHVKVKDLPINEMKSLQEGHGNYLPLMSMVSLVLQK